MTAITYADKRATVKRCNTGGSVSATLATVLLASLALATPTHAQEVLIIEEKTLIEEEEAASVMTFFITSEGLGDGANLGGLYGADTHCATLAAAAGSPDNIIWTAYLSTVDEDGAAETHARDRIGRGPWHNSDGVLIAQNVDELHSEMANLTKETVLTENGDQVNGRGDSPNMHDILTGSNIDGTAFTATDYDNCENWTSNSEEGSTQVGHHDRIGGGQNPTSWNSAHSSRGCSQANLQATGGNGFFYCFGIATLEGGTEVIPPAR